ncbi:MAG: 2-C-methyl-D-erythritol 4-phosphate cytidylyltransferase [Candidatus Omnitrophica bacterium]|nr:2-C-methyl-D-erythritol 4-phosphate cytidylyltransferase [Candidatus Omnitrophota bacterium]MCM8826043.1 2-C-methyl-D-erythritol 4-phosphate cytidylyltransferase [Candidatus Omnitrophota bacterium]
MKFAVILLCAGRGKRLKERVDKAFVNIGGSPFFLYSYQVFKNIKDIEQIIIVARKKFFPLIDLYVKDKNVNVVCGGRERKDSVYQGLKFVREDIEYLIIHDGARPFIDTELIKRVMEAVKNYPAVTLGIKVNDALKKVKKGMVVKTVEREDLYFIQTPQAFKKSLIIKAYRSLGKLAVYDDTQMVEMMGEKVKVIEGSPLNIKITYPQDLILAQYIWKAKNE